MRDTSIPETEAVWQSEKQDSKPSHKEPGTKEVEFPKGTITGAASKDQAFTLAQILVESHNMTIKELEEIKNNGKTSIDNEIEILKSTQKIEAAIKDLDETTKKTLEEAKSSKETAGRAVELLEELSRRQGTGEITIFFPIGSSSINKKSLEYERLVRFLDYLSRESRGRRILLISIGSASAIGNMRQNLKLAERRSEAPSEVIEKYLINTPHEYFKVYGIGDMYSPKEVKLKEHERYQHTRIIALFDKNDTPRLPEGAK